VALQVFTANRLSDGVVVFLSGDERWLEAPDATGVIDTSAMETKMMAVAEAAAAAIVIDPYLITVTDENGEIRPVSLRERIRAYGPSTHPEFTKQDTIADKGF
jgi:hypothetical protein